MRKKALRIVALSVFSTLVFSACGDDEGAATVSAETYMSRVCSALDDWVSDIQQRAAALSEAGGPTDPKSTQKVLDKYVAETVTGTQSLIDEVQAAGVPDIDEGEEAAEEILNAMRAVKSAFEAAREDFAELPTNNREAFAAGLSGVVANIQEATSKATASVQAADSDALSEAFDTSDECSQLQGGA